MKVTKTAVAVAIGVTAGSVLSGGAVAVATHDANTMHGCAATRGGALRLVSAPTDCSKTERPVSWNQQGPAGPAGYLALQFVSTAIELADGDNNRSVYCPIGMRPIASSHTITEGPGTIRWVDGVGDETDSVYYNVSGIVDDPATAGAPTLSVTLTCRPSS